jgi:hypothetical protein
MNCDTFSVASVGAPWPCHSCPPSAAKAMTTLDKLGSTLVGFQPGFCRSPLSLPQLPTLSSLPSAKAMTTLDKLGSTLVGFQPGFCRSPLSFPQLPTLSSLPLAKAVTTLDKLCRIIVNLLPLFLAPACFYFYYCQHIVTGEILRMVVSSKNDGTDSYLYHLTSLFTFDEANI